MNTWVIISSDSDMVHSLGFHKYIDKIRTKTGKWRYIYKKNNELRNKVQANTKMRQRMVENIQKREAQIRNTEDQIIKAARNSDSEKMTRYASDLRKLNLQADVTRESFRNFNNDIDVLKKEYANTPLGKIDSLPGASAVLDFLNDLQRGYYRLRR